MAVGKVQKFQIFMVLEGSSPSYLGLYVRIIEFLAQNKVVTFEHVV